MSIFYRRTALAVALSMLFPSVHAASSEVEDLIVVTATRQETLSSEVLSDVTVIGAEEIKKAGPITSLGELLGRQPGIEFKQSGGPSTISSVNIRGSNASHVLLLVDGIRVAPVTAGTPMWEYIPIEQVERIEIVRGSASSLYGSDAIGGVVQIFTKRGDGPVKPFFEAGYGSFGTSAVTAGLSGGLEGWRYSFQLSEKQSDSFNTIENTSNPAYNPDKDDYQTTSSSGSLSYSPSMGHEFGVNYIYSNGWNRFDGSYPSAATHDYIQRETIYSANLYSRNRLNDNWTSTLRIGQSSDDNRNVDNGDIYSSTRSTQTQYQWQNDIKLSLGSALLGIERVEQHVTSSNNYTLNKRNTDSLLAGWIGQLGDHSLQFNVRQDNNSQFGNKATGMAAYGYQLNSNWRGNLSWGTAFRAPTFNDLYYPSDTYGVSNPDLRPESSENREASVHYETATQHASITYYHNEVQDMIQWAPIDPTYTTTWAWTPQNIANATLSGWTLAYQGKLGNYTLAGSLDLQDPTDNNLQKTLIYRARETAKLSVSRDFGRFNLGGEILATGKRYTDTANTQDLESYALVNLSANYRVTNDWSLFARANNIFDKQYVLTKDFNTPDANIFVGVRYSPQ